VNKNDEWRKEFADWLAGFPWQWFVTLTFLPGSTEHKARWRLRAWVDELRQSLGTDDFEWFAVSERGRTLFNFHFHVLVGGMRRWQATERLEWMRRWNQFSGDALITPFNPDAGGIEYMLKHLAPNETDKLEIHIKSRTTMQSRFGAK
jgi:hypothetical protein